MVKLSLFEKAKEKLFEKDVDRGLELARRFTEKRREYKVVGLVKLNLEAFEAKTESAVIEMNNKCERI